MGRIIGLTGNIATGKSEVGRMLRQLGARLVDADALVHQLMRRGGPVYQAIVDEFGVEMVGQDGEIDRARLGAIVFAAPMALARLEAIVHPPVVARVAEIIQEAREPAVVIEAIKLIEGGQHEMCDELWVVTCPKEQQLARLMAQRGLSEAEALLRIEAQPPQKEKVVDDMP